MLYRNNYTSFKHQTMTSSMMDAWGTTGAARLRPERGPTNLSAPDLSHHVSGTLNKDTPYAMTVAKQLHANPPLPFVCVSSRGRPSAFSIGMHDEPRALCTTSFASHKPPRMALEAEAARDLSQMVEFRRTSLRPSVTSAVKVRKTMVLPG